MVRPSSLLKSMLQLTKKDKKLTVFEIIIKKKQKNKKYNKN